MRTLCLAEHSSCGGLRRKRHPTLQNYMNGQILTAHPVLRRNRVNESNKIRMEVSDWTRCRSDGNKVSTTSGLHKKYRKTLQKAYGEHPTDVPEYYEDNTKG